MDCYTPNRVRNLTYLITMVAIVVTIGLIIYSLDFDSPNGLFASDVPIVALIMLWAISPYAFLAILVKQAKSKVAIIGVLVVCIIACLFGWWGFIDAMIINPDPQSGLAYFVIPM